MPPAILLVDDDPDHLELFALALSEVCPREDVATCTDGREALAYLHGEGAAQRQPRVVVLDMKLGLLTGMDVLRALRADPRTAALPVLMHSCSVDERDVSASYAAGANGYFRKASSFQEQREAARRIHALWTGPVRLPQAPVAEAASAAR